jgi:hypothetical protein
MLSHWMPVMQARFTETAMQRSSLHASPMTRLPCSADDGWRNMTGSGRGMVGDEIANQGSWMDLVIAWLATIEG